MKKIILAGLTLFAAACAPMRHPATLENTSQAQRQTQQPAQQTAEQTPATPAAN